MPRTQNTKQRLLDAATKVFAVHGYEGASTRMLVNEARVNISAIPYYFSSKEGLYQATLEYLILSLRTGMTSHFAEVQQALAKDLSEQESERLLYRFMESVALFMLSDKMSPYAMQIFLREQAAPSPAFHVLYDQLMRPLHETMTQFIARLAHLPFPSDQAILCTQAIIGQMAVFRTHRELFMRRIGWTHYGEDEIRRIVDTVTRHTRFILHMYRQQKV